jgi:DNA-binding NarL/FixJ family response regulator
MKKIFKTMILDDHPLIIDGLVHMFDNEVNFEVVFTAEKSQDALNFLSHNSAIDLIIFDFRIPDMNGYDFAIKLEKFNYIGQAVLLTMVDEASLLKKMNNVGINKIISKSESMDKILSDIKKVAYHNEAQFKSSSSHGDNQFLTETEKIILTRISQGHHISVIPLEMNMSDRSIKYRLTGIYSKLGAANRSQAITLAIKKGIIEL